MIDNAIQEYGNLIGLKNLHLDHDGLLQLENKAIGSLFIERTSDPSGEALFIYLAKQLPSFNIETYKKIFSSINQELPFTINPGLFSDDYFIFSIHLDRESISPQLINQAVNTLITLHENLK